MLRVVLLQPLPAHGPEVIRLELIPTAPDQQKDHKRGGGKAEEHSQGI